MRTPIIFLYFPIILKNEGSESSVLENIKSFFKIKYDYVYFKKSKLPSKNLNLLEIGKFISSEVLISRESTW